MTTNAPSAAYSETLKILRKTLFGLELTIAEIDNEARCTSEFPINKLAQQDGFQSGLEYLQKRFKQYVTVCGNKVKAIPAALYDTPQLQDVYNLNIRTKNENARMLKNPTRQDKIFKPETSNRPVQAVPCSLPTSPPPSRIQPFTFQGPHNVEITRLPQHNRPSHQDRMDRFSESYRGPPPGLNYQDQYQLVLPPGLPVNRDFYSRVPATPNLSSKYIGFNTDEHKYVPPNPAMHYRDVVGQLPESKEMQSLIQRINDIFPQLPIKVDLKPQIMSKYFRKLNDVALSLENVNIENLKPKKEYLRVKTPREFYEKIILALCDLTNGGKMPYNDSLARAIHKLPWLILCHENGMTFADLVKVLNAVPDYFEIYETEKYSIPIYGIKIKLPMSRDESKLIMDQLMPNIPMASYVVDEKGFTSGVVIETKSCNFPYAIRFNCNEDKYNKLAAALMKFSDGQIVQQLYPFMIVLVEWKFIYYRGRVLTISDTKIRVELIDYGDTLNVEPSKLYEMPSKFANYEALAVPAEFISGNLAPKQAKHKAIKHNCTKVLKLRILENYVDHVCFKVV